MHSTASSQLLLNQLSTVCIVQVLLNMDTPWSVVSLQGMTSLKKTDSPFPRNYQMLLVPQLVVRLHTHLPFVCLELAYVFHMLLPSLSSCVQHHLVFRKYCLCDLIYQLCILESSLKISEPCGQGMWYRDLILSLIIPRLLFSVGWPVRISVLTTTYCKNKLLWRGMEDTLMYEYGNKSLWLILIICLFSRKIALGHRP